MDPTLHQAPMAALLAALGLVAGSFLATLALRWPAGRTMSGRSQCDGCQRVLAAGDLIPLLSWAVARRRCRACDIAIDPLHPAMEAACAGWGLAAALMAPGLASMALAGFGWTLMTLAVLDARHFWLPRIITLPLLLAGLAIGDAPFADRMAGAALGYATLAGLALGYRWWRGRDGIGGGDALLLSGIGAWLGWQWLPLVVLSAAAAGIGVVATRVLMRQAVAADTHLPLGSLLAAAAMILVVAIHLVPGG